MWEVRAKRVLEQEEREPAKVKPKAAKRISFFMIAKVFKYV